MKAKHVFVTGEPRAGKTTALVKTIEKLSTLSTFSSLTHIHTPPCFGAITLERKSIDPKWNRLGFDILTLPGSLAPLPGTKELGLRFPFSDNQRAICLDINYLCHHCEKNSMATLACLPGADKQAPRIGNYAVDISAIDKFMVPAITAAVNTCKAKREEHRMNQRVTNTSKEETDQHDPLNDQRNKNPCTTADALLILDEIGKMELLSPMFVAAIREALDQPNLAIVSSVALNSRSPFIIAIRKNNNPLLLTPQNRETLPDAIVHELCS